MWPRSPTPRNGRRGTAQSILANRPSRHLGRLIDKPSGDRALPRAADAPNADTPAAAPFQALRRGGATAGSGGKRGRRGVADKLVGQPQCAADAREADMPTSPVPQSPPGTEP